MRILLPAFAVLPLVLQLQDGRPPERVPGDLEVGDSPEPLGEYSWVVAFPNLRFRRPVYITHPRDGTDRLFVLEQEGIVRLFENRRDVSRADVALDLSDRVYRRHNEEGLLGMAFHPEFRKNRRVFLYYTAGPPRRSVISRFLMDRARKKIDPRSERVILEVRQPYGNHNGGMIEFGPDGYLYISLGDGGWANDPHGHGQNLGTLLGAILRIDVDEGAPYAIPDDNPFKGRPGARGEIWAYGLRNVWRFSFDRVTGALWAADVGQDRWEEINIIRKGGNYGWNLREGRHPFRGRAGDRELIDPVAEYDHREGKSVIGGCVYRGRRLPGLVGAYLYADYESGVIWALRWNGTEVVEKKRLGQGPNISSFGEDRDGEVYFCAFDGRIYRFVERSRRKGRRLPKKLSEVGVFTDMRKRTPHPALLPYSVNVPLWSDGAQKERYLYLPGRKKIGVHEDGSFEFPEGTVFVKTFLWGKRPLETRLLIHGADGWGGFSYAWDQDAREAYLVESRETVPIEGRRSKRVWTFPGPADCMRCHTGAGGRVLGFRIEQLDRLQEYGGRKMNQLEALSKIGIFERQIPHSREAYPDWEDGTADLTRLVRSYLEVNCAMCHRPGGPANSRMDLRASVSLDEMNLVREKPGGHDLGVRDARLIVPGRPDRSLLLLRMGRTDELGMPPLSHNVPDRVAMERIEKWIRGLD